jgi:hypothetical protein
MGLKIHIEMEMPLSKSDAENLMTISMMNVTIANGALADLEPEAADKACGAIDEKAAPQFSICTYAAGHRGRHRYINFGTPLEE